MIAWTDKELKRAFFKILDLSTELTFNFEPNFTGKLKPEALNEVNIQIIKSKYEVIFKLFIDNVFKNDSVLYKKDFKQVLAENERWILNPLMIR
jgi:hypothetical protein